MDRLVWLALGIFAFPATGQVKVSYSTIPIDELNGHTILEHVPAGMRPIQQRGFGYLAPDDRAGYLGTSGIGQCIGLYVRDQSTGIQGLAHLDHGKRFNGRTFQDQGLGHDIQTRIFLDQMALRTDGSFETVSLITSDSSDATGMDLILAELESRGYHDVKHINGGIVAEPVFDRDGQMYWMREGPPLEPGALDRPGMLCANTQGIHR